MIPHTLRHVAKVSIDGFPESGSPRCRPKSWGYDAMLHTGRAFTPRSTHCTFGCDERMGSVTTEDHLRAISVRGGLGVPKGVSPGGAGEVSTTDAVHVHR